MGMPADTQSQVGSPSDIGPQQQEVNQRLFVFLDVMKLGPNVQYVRYSSIPSIVGTWK